MKGKAHSLPYFPSTMNYTKHLQLVYSDLWGPAPLLSTNGNKYYLSFVDAYSKYTWVFSLKTKSTAFSTFLTFQKLVETQLDTTIKSIQIDWGREFRVFQKHWTERGIVHRVTCPYAHSQNGNVERKHRHIVEMGLSMLPHAQMPLKFWKHAFLTAAYIINRIPPTHGNEVSPIEKWFHIKPDYSFIKVFGCLCFPFTRPFNNHKLEFQSVECIFLGYSSSHKGYMCMDSSGKIYISRDVRFDETIFPFHKLFVPHSSTLPASQSSQSHFSSQIPLVSSPSQYVLDTNTLPLSTNSFLNTNDSCSVSKSLAGGNVTTDNLSANTVPTALFGDN